MDRRGFIVSGVALAGGSLLATAAGAQDNFPSRPMRLVVPFPPGGPTDIFGRRYAERLSAALGQQLVVENRAGAGGTIGAAAVANARADGYTMLFGTSSTHVTSPLMLANPPYDPLKDFTLLVVGIVPMVVAVNPSLPARTMQEFLALLKAHPGKYTFSSAGPGSINHLGGELLKLRAGVDALHVPYKGTNPAQLALLSGEVDFLLDTFGTALTHHEAGKMRILATCGERRSPAAPDIPTTLELGIEDSTVTTVNVVALPSSTPAAIVEVIAQATRKVMADEDMVASLTKMSIEPVANADTAKSAAFFEREIARWAPIVRASGVTI
ncbi:MAG TPA: tripartite tricarboxylate transporter substrate binding protein [Burkholderiaceae bacterium]|nr:tripartite tricarboxylate transporter substrate binding protein [Burkholderiaceae bacterium]